MDRAGTWQSSTTDFKFTLILLCCNRYSLVVFSCQRGSQVCRCAYSVTMVLLSNAHLNAECIVTKARVSIL